MRGAADHPHEVIIPIGCEELQLVLGELLLCRGSHGALLFVFAGLGRFFGGAILRPGPHRVTLQISTRLSAQPIRALGGRTLRDLLLVPARGHRIRLGRRLRRRAHRRLLLVVAALRSFAL
jgi:hypothetical protein